MNKQEMQTEALKNATMNDSFRNYPAIFEGFAAKGLAEQDIKPRENIFTYNAWRALGRQVRKGEHGVKITTFISCQSREKDDGTRDKYRRRKTVTVFHVTQTDTIQ